MDGEAVIKETEICLEESWSLLKVRLVLFDEYYQESAAGLRALDCNFSLLLRAILFLHL